jgi:hypothetical protein
MTNDRITVIMVNWNEAITVHLTALPIIFLETEKNYKKPQESQFPG